MGFFDRLRTRADEAIKEHGDKIQAGIEKAAETADRRTKGKYTDKISVAKDKAQAYVEERDIDKPAEEAPAPAPAPAPEPQAQAAPEPEPVAEAEPEPAQEPAAEDLAAEEPAEDPGEPLTDESNRPA